MEMRDRPALGENLEITVEMVNAGLELFRRFEPEKEDEAALVYAIIAKADELRMCRAQYRSSLPAFERPRS